MILYIFILGILAIICYSLFINRIKGLPPGPPPIPFIGNFLNLEVDMDKRFVEWKMKYGRIFTIWVPFPVVVISDHKLLQQHIVKDGDKFSGRKNSPKRAEILRGGEHGLIFNANSIWKEQRRFALHSLKLSGYTSAAIQNLAIDHCHEAISRWKVEGANNQPVDVTKGITMGITSIVWNQIFGRALPYDDPLIEEVNELIRKFVVAFTHPAVMALDIAPSILYLDKFIGSPVKKFIAIIESFTDLAKNEFAIIRKSINEEEEPISFAHAFIREMRRREEKGENLGTFTDKQMADACVDLIIGGLETTVNTLRFVIHYMVNHPEVQRKAQIEIDLHIGKRIIQMEDQKKLQYCNAIIQEVQRLANVVTVAFPRMITSSVNIEGYNIPVGTGVIPEFSIVHLDEKEFEMPEYFCPERHINDKGDFVKDPRITPFSIGKRACLGEGLARMELFLYFTTFIQHINFSSVTKVPPVLNVKSSMTRSPAPFDVLIESRE